MPSPVAVPTNGAVVLTDTTQSRCSFEATRALVACRVHARPPVQELATVCETGLLRMLRTGWTDTLAASDHRRAERLTDLLDSIRAELRTRLDELRPLVREYERLQEAETALADGSPKSGRRTGRPKRSGSQARRGLARRVGSRRRSSSSAEREVNREKVLALVRERPGITKAELKDAAGLSSAGVAQNLRRMLGRGEVREEALPGGATGYRIAEDRPARDRAGQTGS